MNPGIFGDPGLGRSIGLNQGENTNLSHGCYTFLSSGNWVCPDGVFNVWVTGIGGGGGSSSNAFPAGGSGAMCFNLRFAVVPGTVYPVTIGAGGTVTGAGGTTSFGSLLSLGGGSVGGTGLGGLGGGSGGTSALGINGFAGGTVGFDGTNTYAAPGGGFGSGFGVAGQANSGAGGSGNNGGGSGFLTIQW